MPFMLLEPPLPYADHESRVESAESSVESPSRNPTLQRKRKTHSISLDDSGYSREYERENGNSASTECLQTSSREAVQCPPSPPKSRTKDPEIDRKERPA